MTKVDKIMAQVAILIDVEKGNGNEFHTTYDKLRAMIEEAVNVPAGWKFVKKIPDDETVLSVCGELGFHTVKQIYMDIIAISPDYEVMK